MENVFCDGVLLLCEGVRFGIWIKRKFVKFTSYTILVSDPRFQDETFKLEPELTDTCILRTTRHRLFYFLKAKRTQNEQALGCAHLQQQH